MGLNTSGLGEGRDTMIVFKLPPYSHLGVEFPYN